MTRVAIPHGIGVHWYPDVTTTIDNMTAEIYAALPTFLTTETDPVFGASEAHLFVSGDKAKLNSVYATALRTETDPVYGASEAALFVTGDHQKLIDVPFPVGFVDRAESNISFDNSTRTFSISPVTTSFSFYNDTKKFVKTTTQSVVIPDTDGSYYIYFDASGNIQYQAGGDDVGVFGRAYVANLYWDQVSQTNLFLGDDRHSSKISSGTHQYLHETLHSRIHTGFALGDFTIGNGSLAVHAQFSVATGIFYDEDIEHDISALNIPANISIFYKLGSSGIWKKKIADAFPLIYKQAGTHAMADYNQLTGGSWQLTEVLNNQLLLMHYFATNDTNVPIIGICGQATYSSLALARAGANVEIGSIVAGDLPTEEFCPLGTVIFQTSTGFANACASKVQQNADGTNYVNWRNATVSALMLN